MLYGLGWLGIVVSGKYEYIEIPKEQYDKLNEAVREMNTPYRSAEDIINA